MAPQTVQWTPTPDHIAACNLTKFVNYVNTRFTAAIPIGNYPALHAWTVAHPDKFWSAVATFTGFLGPGQNITLDNVLAPGPDPTLPKLVNVSWFHGARVNFAEIVLRAAKRSGARNAICYRPESKSDDIGYRRYITFAELESRVLKLATALRASGVRRGDAVAGVLANSPDTVVAMLASAAVGAVWSCCSPDFGEIAVCERFTQTSPKVLFYSPVYRYKGKVRSTMENMDRIVARLPSLELVLRVPGGCCSAGNLRPGTAQSIGSVKHVLLREFEGSSNDPDQFKYEMLSLRDPVLTMFSSGTTGRPKCIVQGCGILLNQLKEHSLHHETTENSVMLYNTSTGWMLFNWLLAALGTGCTIVLYDGAAIPQNDPYRLVNIAREESVTHFGSGAKYFQALKSVSSKRARDVTANDADDVPVPSLRIVMGTGSPSTEEHFTFAKSFFGNRIQYVSMSGGTEINGCFALGSPWKPVLVSELQCAGLGMDMRVFDSKGCAVLGKSGELVCLNPCPCMPLYFGHDNAHKRYRSSYFGVFGEHVWSHGDFAIQTNHAGFVISGRSDSTLNPGGVRIGTSDIYQVVESIQYVEAALVTEYAVNGDSQVIMFVVTKDGTDLDMKREKEIRYALRTRLSPRHVPQSIVSVREIPYTFSGKKCEIPVKKMLEGRKADNREAVKNPKAFDEILRTVERKRPVQLRSSRGNGLLCKL